MCNVEIFNTEFRTPPYSHVILIAILPILCASAFCIPSLSAPVLAQEEGVAPDSLRDDNATAGREAASSQSEDTPPSSATDGDQASPVAPPPEGADDTHLSRKGETTLPSDVAQPISEETSTAETADRPTSDKEDAPISSDVTEPVVTAPASSEVEQWSSQLEVLIEDLRMLEAEVEDADALYDELSSALRTRRVELSDALASTGGISGIFQKTTSEGPELDAIGDLYGTVRDLHAVRLELLRHVSSGLYDNVTGTGQTGMKELRGELLQLVMYGRVQALLLPRIATDWPTQLKQAPLPLAERILVVIIAIFIFYQWRRWAPGFLKRARESLVEARPRKELKLRVARLIWYLDQVRRPLEWLALLSVLFRAVEFGELQDLEKALSSVAHWLLLAWFAVALINAIVARGVAGLSGETAALRLRSLLVIAAWIVLLGLGLDLAETYLGQGTVYEWVWFLFKLLALPLLLLLIIMWRSEIFRQLSREPQLPGWMKSTVQHRSGIKSFGSAAIGGAYLILRNLQQAFLRSTSELEWGRRFQATLYQRELTRDAARKGTAAGEPIDQALRARLLDGEGTNLEDVYGKEYARLSTLIEQDNVGLAAVVGERGAGKTTFLERVDLEYMEKAVIFDCPTGGYEPFKKALSQALGVAAPDPTSMDFRRRVEETGIRVVAIDNFHRLSRPVKDGFLDMDHLAEFVRRLEIRVLWILALDSAAWHYIRRTRADRIVLLEEIHLPPWTEDQIGNLIDLRCNAAGINPNFGELILPQQLDSVDLETVAEHNRAGFRRLIWHSAGGNPAIALRLWANSLVVAENGEVVVRLAEQQATKELEGLSLVGLLVLRVIAQFDLATDEDIVESLRFSRSEVGNAIVVALRRGWIEQIDGCYSITWDWYRTITTVLARRNLLARLTRGGLI